MTFKTVAVCALVALGVGASTATAGSLDKTKGARGSAMHYDSVVGSCDNGTSGTVTVAGGTGSLGVPNQMSWAQIRAYPRGERLADINRLSFRSNASHPGVVYMKITFEGPHHAIMFSPNTQPGGETGVGTWATHDVLAGTVRLDDDAGFNPDITWSQMLALAGDAHIKDVRMTAGCANPVGSGGGLVRVDDLVINDEVLDFG
jgi:hypothetical protein